MGRSMGQGEGPMVRMENISKRFGGKMALDNACLELHEGEVLGLVGDNGAGKSTLLKILAGVEHSDGGDIFIRKKKARISSPGVSRALGIEMVYQDLALCRNMTIWENIYLGRYLFRSFMHLPLPLLDKRRMAKGASSVLETIGIHMNDTDQPIRNLSGGEQQAVAISRCVLFAPRIILLDEPTASMAQWEKEKIHDLLGKLKSQGRSIIVVAHDLREMLQVADRITVLKEGATVWSGPAHGMGPENLAQLMFVGKPQNKRGRYVQ